MAKKKSNNDDCEFREMCRELGVSLDKPTKLANLGYRAAYSIIASLLDMGSLCQ